MAERPTIGDILTGFGRITDEDVELALQHQREVGGYFGEALIALGMVSEEEIEWSLASQFDLPYVFPDAESIDPEAAGLVTAEWALLNLTLPIMRTSESITVVVDSPIRTSAVDELERRIGLPIELALASPAKIRELIRQVYATGGSSDEEAGSGPPVGLTELVATALERGLARFGVSVRGTRATGWFEQRATVRRRLLSPGWREELERILEPPPSEKVRGTASTTWSAQLLPGEPGQAIEVRFVASAAGIEYLFLPMEERLRVHERFPGPSNAILSEVKLLVRSGSARFAVSSDPPDFARELLPYLPTLLLSPLWRSVHLQHGDPEGEEVFTLAVPTADRARSDALTRLRLFHFDAVTADLEGPCTTWLRDVMQVADAVFVPWDGNADPREAGELGVRWHLVVSRADERRLHWSLEPLER